MQITLVQALLIALWYALAKVRWPVFAIGFSMQFPVVAGYVTGCIMGRPDLGLAIGATCALIYLGQISVGGAGVSDAMLGTMMGTALGILAGVEPEACVALAVPFGLLGNLVNPIVRSMNLFFLHKIQDSLRQVKIKAHWVWYFLMGVASVLVNFFLVFTALLVGATATETFLTNMPGWILNGLNAVGRLLPALGIGLGLGLVAKGSTIAYFIISFFLVKYLGVNVMFCTILAAMVAFIQVSRARQKIQESGMEQEAIPETTGHLLDMKTVYKSMAYMMTTHCWGWNWESMTSTGFMSSMYPVVRKLYPGDEKTQCAILLEHTAYFNTQPTLEPLIIGIAAAMEEQRAMGKPVTPEAIAAVKTGLMGPVAGIGDPLLQSIYMPIMFSISISMMQAGNHFGPWFTFLMILLYNTILPVITVRIGYKGGAGAIERMTSNGLLDAFMSAANIVGCAAFGALAATSVRTTLALSVRTIGESVFEFQSLLDAIAPGIIGLVAVLWVYSRMKKDNKSTFKTMLILMGVALVFGALGVIS